MSFYVEERDTKKLANLEPNYELIKRVKDTKAQYKLTRAERMDNLKDAFEVNPEKNLNKPVLILDDIIASGTTLSFCAQNVLDTYSPKSVTIVTLLSKKF